MPITPALIRPSARKECVCTIGMAPAHTPSIKNHRLLSREETASCSIHSAGMTITQPDRSVRCGSIMSTITLTQRMFLSTKLAGAL